MPPVVSVLEPNWPTVATHMYNSIIANNNTILIIIIIIHMHITICITTIRLGLGLGSLALGRHSHLPASGAAVRTKPRLQWKKKDDMPRTPINATKALARKEQ